MVIASSQHGTLRRNELSITDPGISPRDCFDLSILGSHSRSWSISFLGRKTRVVGHFASRNLSSSFLQTNIFLFTVFYASVKSSARRNTKCHLLGNIMPPYLASSAPFLGLPLSPLAALLSSTDQFLQRPKVERASPDTSWLLQPNHSKWITKIFALYAVDSENQRGTRWLRWRGRSESRGSRPLPSRGKHVPRMNESRIVTSRSAIDYRGNRKGVTLTKGGLTKEMLTRVASVS